ncbi:MAG: glycosyl hydrolase [Alistipes sp.]
MHLKHLPHWTRSALCCACLSICAPALAQSKLDAEFKTPPPSVQTAVYWYWIEGNISKEGVIKDLEAMKEAGINRAFIANIGGSGTGDPSGRNVQFMGDEWWDITHAALKRAAELEIEIGMFNSPGWSQSGGPWVKPEETMRYLASTKIIVSGPNKVSMKMEQPTKHFEDVKVLAFPNLAPKGTILNLENARLTTTPKAADPQNLVDGNVESVMQFPGEGKFTIDLQTQTDFTARSIVIHTAHSAIYTDAELQAQRPDGTYHTVSQFSINRTRDWAKVGFDPYAPVAITINPTTSKAFRIVFNTTSTHTGIAEIELSSTPRIERFKEKTLAKLFQTEVPSWREYLWREQPEIDQCELAVNPTQVLDISDKLSADGTLNWEVPQGEWVVLRTGMAPTGVVNEPACPEATGYEIDKLSKKHAETHFNAYIGDILRRIPAQDRKTFKVLVQDSYEVGGQNFTDDFINIFQKRYGYNPIPYLPTLEGVVIGNQHQSDAFLWDLRRLIADKISYDYVGGMREIAHKHGLITWLENYGHWGFPGEFLQYGGQADEVGGESWVVAPYGEIENHLATSCAHIYGKKLVSSETSTSAGPAYLHTPNDLKQRMDRFFTFGINNTVLHLYIQQPDEKRVPGSNAWFGTEFDRNNIWFKHIDLYTTYIKRCNYMMRQGLYQADVAYFIGEDTPKMVGIQEPALPAGYQFEHINAEVILRDMSVKDGRLVLPHGTSFSVLVLPQLTTMRPELLSKIEKLVAAGAVIIGAAPQRSPSLENQPQADEQVGALAKKLWGNVDGVNVRQRNYGKGMVFQGVDLETVFKQIGCVEDCKFPTDAPIYYGHQQDGDSDIYMISNQGDQALEIDMEFRVSGKQPELWVPLTGEIRPLNAFTQKLKTTVVPLKLEKAESIFVVFRKVGTPLSNSLAVNFPEPTNRVEVKTPWQVRFEGRFKNPRPLTMAALQDLTTIANDSVKYFSGTATYVTNVKIDKVQKGETLMLNLNKVGAMAKVRINGHYVGGVWTTPYKIEVTNFVKKGDNEIEIEVVNTWVNRLVGDMNLPSSQWDVYCFINPHNPKTKLPASGLIGPVRLETVKYNN